MIVITKEWLAVRLATKDKIRVIGRALLAIYKMQTESEQQSEKTTKSNGIGFSKTDARIGSIAALMYANKGTLEQWVVDAWVIPKHGYPRLCKYSNQLNAIAQERQLKAAIFSRSHNKQVVILNDLTNT